MLMHLFDFLRRFLFVGIILPITHRQHSFRRAFHKHVGGPIGLMVRCGELPLGLKWQFVHLWVF